MVCVGVADQGFSRTWVSQYRTHHHPLPTAYMMLLLFGHVDSLALISGTGEPARELLCSNKPVTILFHFGFLTYLHQWKNLLLGGGGRKTYDLGAKTQEEVSSPTWWTRSSGHGGGDPSSPFICLSTRHDQLLTRLPQITHFLVTLGIPYQATSAAGQAQSLSRTETVSVRGRV